MRTALKTLMLASVAFGLAIGAGSSASAAPEIILKGAHSTPPSLGQHVPWVKFKEVVEKESNGRIEVEIYHSSQMGSDVEATEKCQLGVIQLASSSTSNLAMVVPKWQVFELPYILRDTHDNMRLFYDKDGNLAGPVYEALSQDMLKKGLHMLWASPVSFRAVGASRPDMKLPSDLEGLKVRVTASPIDRDVLTAFGINPVAMSLSECYTALQQKTIDGIGIPPDSVYSMKYHEVIKSMLMNRYNGFMLIISMNAKYYDKLPDWAKEVVLKGAKAAALRGNEMWDDDLENSIKKMEESGVTFHYPTDEEWPLWYKAVEKVSHKYESQMDSEWVKTVRKQLGY